MKITICVVGFWGASRFVDALGVVTLRSHETRFLLHLSHKKGVVRVALNSLEREPVLAKIESLKFHDDGPATMSAKTKKGIRIGLDFKDVNGRLYISAVDDSGPFSGTSLLQRGCHLLKVNGHEVIAQSSAPRSNC